LPADEHGNVPKPTVVILGGGFVGLAILNALIERGWPTQVVEAADRLLPRMPAADARLVQERLAKQAAGLHCGVTVQHIKPAGRRKQLLLSNGQSLEADLVIVAVGRKPNLEIAKAAGIRTDRGILVNELLQTNFANIYAAGDVAQTATDWDASETTAREQGRVAGANLAGREVSYRATPQKAVECWPGLSGQPMSTRLGE
jgi:nitrite reductase (NADH) large subunit